MLRGVYDPITGFMLTDAENGSGLRHFFPEAALIVDDQRLRQKFLCLAAILRQHRHRHRDQKYRGKQTPTGTPIRRLSRLMDFSSFL